MGSEPEWDVFISYASEDRVEVAEKLSQLLSEIGVRVWYDQHELKIGAGLRRAIDEGLAKSRFGIVILSPSFFKKGWPNRELDALTQREIAGEAGILPVWHQVTADDVRKYSAPLADKKAALWEHGPFAVVYQLVQVIRPDILEALSQDGPPSSELTRISRGKDVAALLRKAESLLFHNDDPKGEPELGMVAGFVQELQDWSDILDDMEPAEQIRTEAHLQDSITELEARGWSVWGEVVRRQMVFRDDTKVPMRLASVAVLRGVPLRVFLHGNDIAVYRAPAD